jgi:type IV pilus assembly protein PilE
MSNLKFTTVRALRGFSLIELMIIVTIIGILAAVAYPSYQNHAREARRTDGQSMLSQLAADMEKFYAECSAHTSNITATSRSCTTPAGPPAGSLGRGANGNRSANLYYTVTIDLPPTAGVPTAGYRLNAVAQGIQAQDRNCLTLRLDSMGVKSSLNNSGTASTNCWKK